MFFSYTTLLGCLAYTAIKRQGNSESISVRATGEYILQIINVGISEWFCSVGLDQRKQGMGMCLCEDQFLLLCSFFIRTEGTPRVTERCPRTSVAFSGIPTKTPKAAEPGMPLARPAGEIHGVLLCCCQAQTRVKLK